MIDSMTKQLVFVWIYTVIIYINVTAAHFIVVVLVFVHFSQTHESFMEYGNFSKHPELTSAHVFNIHAR